MSRRYVAPALRGKKTTEETTNEASMESNYEKEQEKTRLLHDDGDGDEHLRTSREIFLHYHPEGLGPRPGSSTLHDTAEHPGTLGYLLLFANANPRWDEDHLGKDEARSSARRTRRW
ncbi:hypothetical protein PV08_02495 [Exophiala spinifera]|uniref:Uncharacterized protein n=1 Tax=Exophiala spinifera TaxID=91928 RepID=A0A0D1ZZQ0_9EURO|nr:uncharacterized protein PV08_02495 [Exophiala spinifera]KIW18207.1 hypothetical protein PV08_02495 [Exophiala spinifera]